MQKVSMKNIPDAGGGRGLISTTGGNDSQIERIKHKVNQFLARHGRRPRVLVSHIGPDGRRHALNQVAAVFARRGFDVDIGPICQSPHQVALMAIENDVHMVCLLCNPDQQSQMVSQLMDIQQAHGNGDILVAFFGDKPLPFPSGRTAPARIHPATTDADIISVLGKLAQKN